MALDRACPLASIPALLLGALLWLSPASPALAGGTTLLRDADIENALMRLGFPILRAAGLNPRRVRILVVDDGSLNAFVVDHRAIYIHYGLILKAPDALVVQAVIAHEAAHIANGHIARRIDNLRSAQGIAGLGAALAVIAAAAGAGEAAGGIAIGTQSSALRSFLKHTRAEEASADRSALGYMVASDVDPRGMVALHEMFRGQELLSVGRQDPYMQSHPLTRDRIRAAGEFAAAASGRVTPNPDDAYWFSRVRGKLSAFTRSSKWTMQRAGEETYPDIRLMRQAAAHHQLRDLDAALRAIDGAIALRPEDAYYLDLKGQILMENRRWQAAVSTYETAVALAPKEALILAGYGHALLASGRAEAAIAVMEQARDRDWRDARLLRDMSLAYARTGATGMAALVTAERYALEGRFDDALIHARRAVALLPRGSTAWQRAEDVLIASEHQEKRKKR